MRQELINAAKRFLIVYFSDGIRRRPSDFDHEILGGIDEKFYLRGRPRWNETPFFHALGELIETGVITYEKTEEAHEYYLTS